MHTQHSHNARAFTLLELLVVISIIAVLVGLLLPALGKVRDEARSAVCGGNLHQMAMALQMYTDDYKDAFFPECETTAAGKSWWFGFETTASAGRAEGERELDRTRAKLYPYYQTPDSIEVCPSFPIGEGYYKPKYQTNWTTYGFPQRLMKFVANNPLVQPNRRLDITTPSDTLAFADSAQVNRFQAPASPGNPMIEQWHYVAASGFVYYNHDNTADAAMMDGHVRRLEPEFGYYTGRGGMRVGRPPSDVIVQVD